MIIYYTLWRTLLRLNTRAKLIVVRRLHGADERERGPHLVGAVINSTGGQGAEFLEEVIRCKNSNLILKRQFLLGATDESANQYLAPGQ